MINGFHFQRVLSPIVSLTNAHWSRLRPPLFHRPINFNYKPFRNVTHFFPHRFPTKNEIFFFRRLIVRVLHSAVCVKKIENNLQTRTSLNITSKWWHKNGQISMAQIRCVHFPLKYHHFALYHHFAKHFLLCCHSDLSHFGNVKRNKQILLETFHRKNDHRIIHE